VQLRAPTICIWLCAGFCLQGCSIMAQIRAVDSMDSSNNTVHFKKNNDLFCYDAPGEFECISGVNYFHPIKGKSS
jgi:hypothetical protein